MREAVALVSVLLLSTTFVVPVGQAGSCSDNNSGPGNASAACAFTCEMGDVVHISASVDDEGSVYASGNCGMAVAECVGTGSCSGQSPEPVNGQGGGPCEATGRGGAWTRVAVNCWSQTSGSGSVVPDLGELPDCGRGYGDLCGFHPCTVDMVAPTLETVCGILPGSAPASFNSMVAMRGTVGDMRAFACTPGGCIETTVTCDTSLIGWHCLAY